MKRKFLLLAAIAILALAAGTYGALRWQWNLRKPDVPLKIFGSQQTLDSFLAATDFTAERLGYSPDLSGTLYNLGSYKHGAPIRLSAKQARLVQLIFAQESTYSWIYGTACAPDYGVLITAHSNGGTIRIAVCFKCHKFGVFNTSDDSAEPVNDAHNLVAPASRALAALAKELFPNDPEIQHLK